MKMHPTQDEALAVTGRSSGVIDPKMVYGLSLLEQQVVRDMIDDCFVLVPQPNFTQHSVSLNILAD